MSHRSFRAGQEQVGPAWAPAAEGGGAERRASPTLRPTVQTTFERLRDTLRKAGRKEVLQAIGDLDRVDDVLRTYPAQVPTFLELAWQLRDQPDFVGFFHASDGSGPVTDRDTPISPCDLTFNQIVRAHLYGAARLVFERREREWAERRARKEASRRQKRRDQDARGSLSSRLMNPLKTMWEADSEVDPDQLRSLYPGHGLYAILKPYLRDPWQFAFIEHYARLSTAQARVLGHLIGYLRSLDMMETVVGLDVEELAVVRAACRAFAETHLHIKQDKGPRWEMSAEAAKERDEAEERIRVQESITFDTILVRHPGALDAIRTLGLDVRPVVRRLTPIYGEDVWSVLDSPVSLENARRVPDHLLGVLGRLSHLVPPDISAILGHIRDHALAQDLLTFAREDFSDNELANYLSDPSRKPIWNALPAKFNNNYKYQRDARSGMGTLHNNENLRTVSTAIFHSLRLGQVETF
jgi:hypothetical protein